jgi:glyoxylase-like metal-dependent hydrolase (beta-lactamase superfamily II)
MLPHGFLRAAATRNPTLTRMGNLNVVAFQGANGATVRGYINGQNQVERVATMIDNAVMGDTPFEAVYLDYRTINGVQWPMQIIQRTGGYPTFDLKLSDVKINAPVNIVAQQGGGGGGGGGGQQQGVPVVELAPGVLLFNSGYAPMAFDMGDHILFLEPGNSEARALQVIAEAKRRFPGKPVRYVVNTHTHFDHSSGLRAFVAEGATILTHEMNRGYVEEMMRRPHTLNPDAQERANQPVKVQGVPDRHVITGNGHTIELHRIQNFGHQPAVLMAYLPQHRILYEADMYNAGAANATPPATPSPYNLALLENVQRLNLQVDRIIPTHYPADNRVVTMEEVRRMVGRATN